MALGTAFASPLRGEAVTLNSAFLLERRFHFIAPGAYGWGLRISYPVLRSPAAMPLMVAASA